MSVGIWSKRTGMLQTKRGVTVLITDKGDKFYPVPDSLTSRREKKISNYNEGYFNPFLNTRVTITGNICGEKIYSARIAWPKKTGILQIKNGTTVLITDKKALFNPVPYSINSEQSQKISNQNKVFGESSLDKRVTVSGNLYNNMIYDAKIVRTKKYRNPNKPHRKNWWNNRHTKINVHFKGRRIPDEYIPESSIKREENLTADIRQMITINDSVIEKDLRDNELMVEDPRCCNEDIFNIYLHTRIKKINPYKYDNEPEIYGCEYFMYPYELRAIKQGDCDDWGIELASYLITAGVPEWRVRCVVGKAKIGGGHLTVYVLGDDRATWYHLNSTSPWEYIEDIMKYTDLTKFPTSKPVTDYYGIEDIWFSFNNKYAWHDFENYDSEDKVKEYSWYNKFQVIPLPINDLRASS